MSVSPQGHEAQSKCDPGEKQIPEKLTENIAFSGLIMKKLDQEISHALLAPNC